MTSFWRSVILDDKRQNARQIDQINRDIKDENKLTVSVAR